MEKFKPTARKNYELESRDMSILLATGNFEQSEFHSRSLRTFRSNSPHIGEWFFDSCHDGIRVRAINCGES